MIELWIRVQALSGFGALSQENRLEIVRLLVRAGLDGLPAGEIAEAVGISPSNLSFHLKELETAKLVAGRREVAVYDLYGQL